MSQRRGRGGYRAAGQPAGGAARGGRGRVGHAAPSGASRPAAGRDGGNQRVRLRRIIEPVVNAHGYDLEGLSLSRAGRRHLVRLIVDGDGGVSLDAVAAVSREVSAALDAAEQRDGELFAGEYELQVSSPGVERPLTLPRHWRRNTGRLVRVRTGAGQVTGRVISAGDEVVVLDVDGVRHEVPYADLGPGKVQLEFNRLAAMSDADLEDLLDPIDDDGTGDDVDAGYDEQEDGE